jgi:hypothetical protein
VGESGGEVVNVRGKNKPKGLIPLGTHQYRFGARVA